MVYDAIFTLWYTEFRFFMASYIGHFFLNQTICFALFIAEDHWASMISRYFTVTLHSVLLLSSIVFWGFCFFWWYVLEKPLVSLNLLKFFPHIAFCCLSSLLLQEQWLIIDLGFLFMSIFPFSITSGGEELGIFSYFCIGKDHISALLLQMTFCIWHIQSSSSRTEPLSLERQKRRNHASLLIKLRRNGSNSWLKCHVVLHVTVLWQYSSCRELKWVNQYWHHCLKDILYKIEGHICNSCGWIKKQHDATGAKDNL